MIATCILSAIVTIVCQNQNDTIVGEEEDGTPI